MDHKLMHKARAGQQKAARDQQAGAALRREALARREPRLAELDNQIRDCFLSAMRSPAPDGVAGAERESLRLQSEQAALLDKMGLTADDYKGRPLCAQCSDAGFLGDAPCECVWERYRALQAKELSFMLNLEGQNFDCFDSGLFSDAHDPGLGGSPREQMEVIYEICVNFSRRFDGKADNLMFSGPPGTGKTFMSSCVAGAVNERGFSVVYDTAEHILQKMDGLRFGRGDEDAEADVRRLRRCELLIIDDLGAEYLLPSALAALMDIADTRIKERKTMLVSTNLNKDELRERYKGPLASRLLGEFTWLDFGGEDLRLKKNG